MLLKTSAIAICSGSGSISSSLALTGIPACTTSSSSSASPRPRKQRPGAATVQVGSRRFYATENAGQGGAHAASGRHAECLDWPASKNPTPYEIFNQKRGAPYRKAKFLQLVMLYHPDRHQYTINHGISPATRLERYRLVVAANDILCDPAKRRAYDLYGAGWAGRSDMWNNSREADRSWRERPGSAAMNATWEDWEQWYKRRDGEKKEPVFMSNGLFAVAVSMCMILAWWGQATRAGRSSLGLVDARELKHREITADMWKRRHESAMLTREERVEYFLRHREDWSEDAPARAQMPRDQGGVDLRK